MQYPINDLYVGFLKKRDYLISELGVAFDKDELLKITGRLIELNIVIKTIEEMEGMNNEQCK